MLNRFRNFISRHKLFDTQDRILLAVSGGLDSMVMLDLFKEAKLNFGVAHCNFQLRGDASDEEEVLVNQSCHRYGVECYSKRFETNNYAEKSGQSIQMAARE
ncbi:MAG TPA: ATP-binding protein, partial [Cyclobacteriaceae bacterium]|nr:ATP-binding protein [Cyclobacteriaceae bacterium]